MTSHTISYSFLLWFLYRKNFVDPYKGPKSKGSFVFYLVLQDHRMSELKGVLDVFISLVPPLVPLKSLVPPLPSSFSANDLVSYFLEKIEEISKDHPQVASTMCTYLPGASVPLDLSFSPDITDEPLCYWLRRRHPLVYSSSLLAHSKTRA